MPGPTIMTGTVGLNGSLNWDFRTKMGTVGLSSSVGIFLVNQLVATPRCWRPVGVFQSTKMAVMWMEVGFIWTQWKKGMLLSWFIMFVHHDQGLIFFNYELL